MKYQDKLDQIKIDLAESIDFIVNSKKETEYSFNEKQIEECRQKLIEMSRDNDVDFSIKKDCYELIDLIENLPF